MTYTRLNPVNSITVESFAEVSTANNTATKLGEITLSAGKWLLIGTCSWATSASGVRRLSLSDSNSLVIHRLRCTTALPVSGGTTLMPPIVEAVTLSEQKTYYLYGIQTSGGSLGASPAITAIKLA